MFDAICQVWPERQSMAFEVLNRALVCLGFFARSESSQVAALAGLGIFLAGVEAVLAGRQFADHSELHVL
jgi:hypothetical protein